jgi:hypothetical protein
MIWFLVSLMVVVTMTLWNKVSSASPYLNDVRSGIGEGPRRVWFVKSIGCLQILAVVLILRSSWLTFYAMIKTSSFGLFDSKAWYFQLSVLMVKNWKYVFFGGFLEPYSFIGYWISLSVASDFCSLQSHVWR